MKELARAEINVSFNATIDYKEIDTVKKLLENHFAELISPEVPELLSVYGVSVKYKGITIQDKILIIIFDKICKYYPEIQDNEFPEGYDYLNNSNKIIDIFINKFNKEQKTNTIHTLIRADISLIDMKFNKEFYDDVLKIIY